MKMDSSQKMVVLEETYDLLKDNYSDNGNGNIIQEIIGKVAKIDLNRAIEMWKELIKMYPDVLHNSWDFSYALFCEIGESIGHISAADAVFADEELTRYIYSEGRALSITPIHALRRLANISDYEKLDTVINYIIENKYSSFTLYDCLYALLEYEYEVDEEFVDYIYRWMENITNKEERAKLNVKLLNFID
ncbi:MAG: hypothetical protein SO251_00140 [Candidatus Fimisoma sp.]|nr:hypothetical protein [Candidatus Fimisoma sp.]